MIYKSAPMFEAFLVLDIEGPRRSPFYQRYRPDVRFDGDELLYPIYPVFIDEEGVELPEKVQIPSPARARMHPLSDEARDLAALHVVLGSKFRLHEGSSIVGFGTITKVF